MAYDPSNIFARILRGEIPCKKVYEDEWALAFHDINPLAPVHVLVIPKGAYVSMADFTASASTRRSPASSAPSARSARQLGLDERGYRMLANHGADAHQEVPHLHVHLFAGAPLGPMLKEGRRVALLFGRLARVAIDDVRPQAVDLGQHIAGLVVEGQLAPARVRAGARTVRDARPRSIPSRVAAGTRRGPSRGHARTSPARSSARTADGSRQRHRERLASSPL